MKIVKQMLMQLGTLYEKSDTRRAYNDSLTLHLEFQFVSATSNKRPTGLNGNLSIRDLTPTSCQKD